MAEDLTAQLCVIGVGNPDRGDDAVGPVVARRLKEELGCTVSICEQNGEGTALMHAWQGADAVVLIDAMHSGAEAGTWSRFEVSGEPLPAVFAQFSTHTFSVAEAIELARALHTLPPRVVVYGIEGKTFALGADLSAQVERVLSQVVKKVRQEIANWQETIPGDSHA